VPWVGVAAAEGQYRKFKLWKRKKSQNEHKESVGA
jgi:hypothetical protein